MTAPTLKRETFVTSRLSEYFRVKELAMQIGHGPSSWPIVLIKELIDNALDACERDDIAPEISVAISEHSLVVEDNGPGLPAETVKRSLDFAVRVSTNSQYVSPTRGQLGNALKTIWGAAFVVGDGYGLVQIDTPGIKHVVTIRLDALTQEPVITHEHSPCERKTGTSVYIRWPWVACLLKDAQANGFSLGLGRLVESYATFNPHASICLSAGDDHEPSYWLPTAPDWTKWKPSNPTSAHWYAAPQLADLIGAYVSRERQRGDESRRSVRDFVKEFRGLTSTAKLKVVAEAAELHGATLADLCTSDRVDPDAVGRLLAAMQAESRPVEAKHLGSLGRQTLRARVVESYGVAEASFMYEKIECILTGSGVAGTTIPVVLEVAFAVRESGDDDAAGRQILTGVNWSPTVGDGTFPTLLAALDRANVPADDPVVMVVHLALPSVAFTDRGKHRLSVDVSGVLNPSIEKVTRAWTKAKRQRTKIQQAALKRLTEKKQQPLWIKDACFQVMEQAYLKASANNTLPAKGRQIMYAARPEVMKLTGGEFYKADTQTFQQRTLIDYIEQHPDVTARWNVVWDDRGHVREPHTDRQVGLGTLGVRRYLRAWTDGEVGDFRSGIDRALATSALVGTSGPSARYGTVLFIEKEGFNELFDAVLLRERYDLAIMSTKGMSVTAARELVDGYGRAGIPVFVLHDFDKSGLSIAHTLGTSSRRYTFQQSPRLIDLGLRLVDVQSLGLERLAEDVEYDSKIDPRVNLAESGATEDEQQFLVSAGRPGKWVGRRVELNALTSDQFIAWLEAKLRDHGVDKIVPAQQTLEDAYRRAWHIEQIRRAIDSELGRLAGMNVEVPGDLAARVSSMIKETPDAWDAAVVIVARERAGKATS